jgi:DNA helicase-4
MNNSSSFQNLEINSKLDLEGTDISPYPSPYQRQKSLLLIAYWLGLTSVKKVSFSKDGICVHYKKRQVLIFYQDIRFVSIKGFPFKSLKISTSKKVSINGLKSNEATDILMRVLASEELAWSAQLSDEANQISQLSKWIDQIQNFTYFQRHSVFNSQMRNAKSLAERFGERLPNALKETDSAKELLKIRNFLTSSPPDRRAINTEYIKSEINRSQDLFDNIEKNPLTEEQRKSVVVDEDANLVIASAGSGKTSVIVAKTAWILEKAARKPSEVLLLAFASAARKEMSERLAERILRPDISEVNVHTFHSLGLHVIGQATEEKPSLSKLAEDEQQLIEFIKSTIQQNLNDPNFRDLINTWFEEFFAKYESHFDFKNQGQYWDYLRKNNIRSLKGEKLKSFEECQVANFLALNGIEYQYEANYQHKTANSQYRQYKPDFFLPQFGVYIEHLGLKGFGRTAPFVERKPYLESLRWKRELHKKHGTTLVETYSCEKEKGILSKRLREKLEAVGVQFSSVNPEVIFKTLSDNGQIDTFTNLVVTFLGHFKGSHLTENDLWARISEDKESERSSAFIRVFMPIFQAYENALKTEDAIDFHDMISMATEHIKTRRFVSPFRYVMVDEFQDISVGRTELIKALQKSDPDVQLYCVGDDWQAIFRFAGSYISVMKEFGEHFGVYERSDLTTTFRSEKTIVDEATNFVLQNNFQILKLVKAIRKTEHASINVGFLDPGDESRMKILHSILQAIVDSERFKVDSDVLVLGRYKLKTYFNAYKIDYRKILNDLGEHFPQLKIKFLSVHRSKGLEADYVIVLDVLNDFLGFPNEMVDDPILNLVLSKPEVFPNSEERRLFYVALTRAKEKVYLLTETGKVSPFINEVIQSPFDVEIFGRAPNTNIPCPECRTGVMNLKKGQSSAFWGCSNFPYCKHTEQACPHCHKGYLKPSINNVIVCKICEQSVEKCPTEGCNGWLQVRSGPHGNFLGCTEFFKSDCRYKRNIKAY